MDRDLVAWNLGMADAESGSLARTGGSRDYHDGYDYACAVDYEYIGARPEGLGNECLDETGDGSDAWHALRFSTELNTLNSSLAALE